ncbi:ADP-ribosylglycohydrolase family protein [Microbacterium sp. HJ5]
MRAVSLLEEAQGELQERVLLTLMAFAAGDAFGVAYEYTPEPLPVDMSTMGARADWPLGGVSDDTLLSLLTIFATTPADPEGSARVFLQRLRRQAHELRGLGPTTRAALGMDVDPQHAGIVGQTNGGMMRTSLLGLGFPVTAAEQRRRTVAHLTWPTHQQPAAIACAVLCSRLYSEAVSTGVAGDIHELLRSEAAQLDELPASVAVQLDALETWVPPTGGVPLEPGETLLAVVWVVRHSKTLEDAYRLACELGGDTDTVAALAGGLVAARSGDDDELLELPWIDDVLWSEVRDLRDAAEVLTQMRTEN